MINALTSALELAGSLLIVAAIVVLLWPLSPALALGVCGVLLVALSWLLTRLTQARGGSS